FAIIVGVLMFVVAAYSYKYACDNFILYLATGYFWVAAMDLIHTLLYKGMAIYPIDLANHSTQFWIANRYFESLLLLSAPLLCNRWLHNRGRFIVFGLIAVACYALIMTGHFPDAYIEGEGLTRFKIISEYIICLILVLAMVSLYRHKGQLKSGIFPFLTVSIVLTIFAELAFTNYISVYSPTNFLGHIFKLFSFWLILYSIVRSSLQDPYQALATSRALLQGLRDNIPDLIFYKDKAGVYLGCNQAFCDFIGKEHESDIIGATDFDLFDKELAQFFRDKDRQMLEAGAAKQNDEWVTYPDGSRKLLDTLKTPFLDSQGNVIGLIGISRDITEKVKAQTMLENERGKAQRYLDLAGVIFVALDDRGNITLINKKGCEVLGYAEEDMLNRNWFELCVPAAFRQQVEVVYRQLMTGEAAMGEYYENPVLTSRGEQKIIAFHNIILRDDEGLVTGILSSGEDLTDRKRNEIRLRKLSQAVEQAGEAMVITDGKGTIEYANPAFTQVTGYRLDELLGENPSVLQSGKQDAQFYVDMWETLTRGEVWQGKLINEKKDGSHYPAMLTIAPMLDEAGGVTNYIGIQKDLTEYEALEGQFHQSQKMEAVGTLIGGIAHDFNNTLAGITGNLYMAKKAAAELPDVVNRLSNVENFAFRASSMIQQLLTFSRKGTVQMNPISITPFLKEVIKLQEVSVPENISLTYHIQDIPLTVNGDINLLQQVLINLINNARDALESVEKPVIFIELEQQSVNGVFLRQNPNVKSAEVACITVRDNGKGMAPEVVEHIFEPFFTTKGVGKGTGLGLSMVFGAIQSHGGAIRVESTQGQGTAFHIYLPLEQSSGTDNMADSDGVVVPGLGETILLVDDEASVLSTGKDVLESLNYKVLTASDGQQAVALYAAHQGEIDLLILDVVMPNMGGLEALQQIRKQNPDVKALFASGYDKSNTLIETGRISPDMMIRKPYSVIKLSQLIRASIDK
ncbi:MAG: hypothetical protein CO187_03655, partial [Zetaproteobacteria bacterium CG_4_9_14_3_um_filter_53_7]